MHLRKPPVFVFAGSAAEAQQWANENTMPGSSWRQVSRPDQLTGYRPGKFVLVGRWDRRHDKEPMVAAFRAHGFVEWKPETNGVR